jgi:hypothetical protein
VSAAERRRAPSAALRVLATALAVAATGLGPAAPFARGAADDPLFLVRPAPPHVKDLPPLPPTRGVLEGPCGIAVDAAGGAYVSNYYNDSVDVFGGGLSPFYPYGYSGQIRPIDSFDGPCALALDGSGDLYVNDFHRSVVRYTSSPLGAGTVVAGAPLDAARPTGVATDPAGGDVYVDERTRVAVFDSGGAELGQVGAGDLEDGYGIARSGYPATEGLLYVPDAATDTVKVYAPIVGLEDPVAVIDGSGTPAGHFTSLRDAAVAIDDQSGQVYVTDVVAPELSEASETVVDVFDSGGTYEGRLKYSLESALPPGLAVDNSSTATQGRVYVTTGNTESAAVYVYPPGAATGEAVPLSRPAAAPSGDAGTVDRDGGSATAGGGAASAVPADAAPPSAVAASIRRKAGASKRGQQHRRRGRRHRRREKGR